MLSAIREIGKWQIAKTKKNDIDILTKKPNFKDGGKLVFIKISLDENKFGGVELEDYDSDKLNKYLFRGGVSQGPNPTPIANIINAKKGKTEEETKENNVKQIQKTFSGKIQKWFDKYSTGDAISKEDTELLKSINNILLANHDQIISSIESCTADIPKKEGKLLSIKIKNDNDIEWQYIGEFEIFKKFLKETESKNISGVSTYCAICGKQKELSENPGVFRFYTIDKPGFITGGFDESFAWKNFPVCPECKLELEEGKKFAESNLIYKFCGLRYFLIPKLFLGNSIVMPEIFSILLDSNKVISLKDRVKKRIKDDENEILELLSDEKDALTLNFLFLKKENSAERILLLIEDVFPSRIKKIFEAKNFVDKISGGNFTFRNLRDFFAKSDENKKDYDLNKYFLDIVDKIFRGTSIDFSFLVRFYMNRIRKEFINDGFFNLVVKSAILSTLFFENLDLITFEEEDMEENIFEEVFKKYGNAFSSPVKRGLFLTGALTEMLLRKQYAQRKSKPFTKRLKSLKMDETDIKGLVKDVQNKFEEYNAFDKGKRIVAKEAYNYLCIAGDGWKMSLNEINFYFAAGMNLLDIIIPIIYPNEKDVDQEIKDEVYAQEENDQTQKEEEKSCQN